MWDAVNGEPVSPPLVHEDLLWGAALSPKGTRVVEQSFEFDLTSTSKLLSRYLDKEITEAIWHDNNFWPF